MKNKYNALQILTKVYRHTLKAVPFSGVSGILNYLVQGLFPAFTALIQARLFEAAYSLTQGADTLTVVILYEENRRNRRSYFGKLFCRRNRPNA